MKNDQIKLYLLELLLAIILFITLIVSNKVSNMSLALTLMLFALIFNLTLKKKKILSTNARQVNFMIIAYAILYVAFYYFIGIIVNSFLKTPTPFTFKTIVWYILPMTLIIVSSEIIRMRLLSQDKKLKIFNKNINLSIFLTFIIMVLIDLIVYTRLYNLSNLDDFLLVIGFVLFSSISCNLFFNYIANRYGIKGVIVYRLITTLYYYIIPIVPDVYVFFKTFLRMIYPFQMYLVIESTYAKTLLVSSQNTKRKNFVGIVVALILMSLLIMLISCKFKYGVLVVGSKSMTGSIDMGDAVLYERLDNRKLEKGKVVVFKKNGLKLIHRIVDIRNVNGQIRYYTKGDANPSMDSGYITKNEIIGFVNFKIKYIGYPTIWLNQMFN